MELVKDLGTRPRNGGGTKRWGLYRCPECNKEFELVMSTVNNRKRRGGANACRACANKSNLKVQQQFKHEKAKSNYLLEFIRVHGDRYDYSKFVYTSAWDKSTIICKEHGEFLQAYADHREGHGCPHCANEENSFGLRKDVVLSKPTILYYLYLPEHDLWKIGVTSNSVAKRFIEDKNVVIEVLDTFQYSSGYEAYAIEKYILRATSSTMYKGGMVLLKGGNSELRTQPIENLSYLIRKAESLYNSVEEDYIYH